MAGPKVQFSRDRVAFYTKDPEYEGGWDIKVFDLSNGREILSCSKDLHLPARSSFLLRDDQLIIIENGKLHRALF